MEWQTLGNKIKQAKERGERWHFKSMSTGKGPPGKWHLRFESASAWKEVSKL
jgi:hypothetical protein